MLEPWEELRPTWRRCAVGRTGWLWSERLPHGSFEEPENKMIGDLFKRRSGTVVNPMSQVNHLAEEMTLPSRLGHHQWGEDARHHHDRVWEESWTSFWSRWLWHVFLHWGLSIVPYSMITSPNSFQCLKRRVTWRYRETWQLSIFGITWNNNWVPEWRKPKKTVAWGCQCLYYTLNMVGSNSRQALGSFEKLLPNVTCLSLAQPEQRKQAMTRSGRRAIREVVRPPNHQSCCSIGVLKEFHKTIGHQGGKHNCQKWPYLEIDVSHAEIDNNGSKRQKYAVHLRL